MHALISDCIRQSLLISRYIGIPLYHFFRCAIRTQDILTEKYAIIDISSRTIKKTGPLLTLPI
jgi:hypothetical protein